MKAIKFSVRRSQPTFWNPQNQNSALGERQTPEDCCTALVNKVELVFQNSRK
jgi:hypothetical protein